MSWTRDWAASRPPRPMYLEPERVLYEFDEPLTFTARMGVLELLASKVDERQGLDLYIAVVIGRDRVEALASGAFSLRGAISQPLCYLVEVGERWQIERYWECDSDEVPDSYLPEASIGLDVSASFVADAMEQLTSFFAYRFTGKSLSKRSVQFGLFKGLVNEAYEASRRILAPGLLAHSKSSTFDFNIGRPAFGSLVLAVGEPRLNVRSISKIVGKNADLDGIRDQFAENRLTFLSELGEVTAAAADRDLTEEFALEHFELLDRVDDLLPTEDSRIEGLHFTAAIPTGTIHQAINTTVGERMRKAHQMVESRPRDVVGQVVIINTDGRKVTLRATSGRKVTCEFPEDVFKELVADRAFKQGVNLKVSGKYIKRQQRDLMLLEQLPEILEHPT